MNAENRSLYTNLILSQAERLLSLEDRNVSSPTFGCFDRDYWAWKFKDIQDACMQNGVYALAILWANNFEGNIYFKNEHVLGCIMAGIERWCNIQHKDGSFDQIFPNEHSYGAASLTLFYMLETYNIVANSLKEDLKSKFFITIKKAAGFIMKSNETHGIIANHLCAASAGLFSYHIIFQDQNVKSKAREILSSLFKGQNEGWLPEYAGADVGYQTLALYYLAKYYLKSQDSEILDKLKDLVSFISYFIYPGGSIGTRYGSRRTEVLYPAGLALLKEKIPLAKRIIDTCFSSPLSEGLVSLNAMDDSNLIPLLISYLETFILQAKSHTQDTFGDTLPLLPFEQDSFSRHFEKAGIFIRNSTNYYAVISLNSNGLLNVYDKNKRLIIYDDYGYFAKANKGRILSSQFFNPHAQLEIAGNTIIIRSALAKVSLPVPTPGNILILRIINLTFCRIRAIRELIKQILVRILIGRKARPVIFLERRIEFLQDSIRVTDKLLKPEGLRIIQLYRVVMHSTQHMATSSYFKKSQIRNLSLPLNFDLDKFNRESKLEIFFSL